MRINKHLMKKKSWKLKNRDYAVVLLKAINTIDGISFCAEIADGEHKGKWTSVLKKEIIGRA